MWEETKVKERDKSEEKEKRREKWGAKEEWKQRKKKGGEKKKILVRKKNNIQFLSKKNEEFDLTTNPFKERGMIWIQQLITFMYPNEQLQEAIQRRFKYQIKKIMEWLTLESD